MAKPKPPRNQPFILRAASFSNFNHTPEERQELLDILANEYPLALPFLNTCSGDRLMVDDWPIFVTGNPWLEEFIPTNKEDPGFKMLKAVRLKYVHGAVPEVERAFIEGLKWCDENGIPALITMMRFSRINMMYRYVVDPEKTYGDGGQYRARTNKVFTRTMAEAMRDEGKKARVLASMDRGNRFFLPFVPRWSQFKDYIRKELYFVCDARLSGCPWCQNCGWLAYGKRSFERVDEESFMPPWVPFEVNLKASRPRGGRLSPKGNPHCHHDCPECFARNMLLQSGGLPSTEIGQNMKQKGATSHPFLREFKVAENRREEVRRLLEERAAGWPEMRPETPSFQPGIAATLYSFLPTLVPSPDTDTQWVDHAVNALDKYDEEWGAVPSEAESWLRGRQLNWSEEEKRKQKKIRDANNKLLNKYAISIVGNLKETFTSAFDERTKMMGLDPHMAATMLRDETDLLRTMIAQLKAGGFGTVEQYVAHYRTITALLEDPGTWRCLSEGLRREDRKMIEAAVRSGALDREAADILLEMKPSRVTKAKLRKIARKARVFAGEIESRVLSCSSRLFGLGSLKVVCATCGKVLGEKEGGEGISHGICPTCRRVQEIEDLEDEKIEAEAVKLFGVAPDDFSVPFLFVLRDGTILGNAGDYSHYDVCAIDGVLEHGLLTVYEGLIDDERPMTLQEARAKWPEAEYNNDLADKRWSSESIDICPESFMRITGAARTGEWTYASDAAAMTRFFTFHRMPSVAQARVMARYLETGAPIEVELLHGGSRILLSLREAAGAQDILNMLGRELSVARTRLDGLGGPAASREEVERQASEFLGVIPPTAKPDDAMFILRDGTLIGNYREHYHADICQVDAVLGFLLSHSWSTYPELPMTLEELRGKHPGEDNLELATRIWEDAAIQICPDAFMEITGAGRIGEDLQTINFREMPTLEQAAAISRILKQAGHPVDVEVGLPYWEDGSAEFERIYREFHRPMPAQGILATLQRDRKPRVNLEGTTGKVPNLTSPGDLERLAVEKFGVTKDPVRAGFVLADGRLLDLGGHDPLEVSELFNAQELDFVLNKPMYRRILQLEFMARTGAVRVDSKACAAESPSTFPTAVQAKALEGFAFACGGTVLLETWKRGNPRSKLRGFFTAGGTKDAVRVARTLREHPERFNGEKQVDFLVGKKDWGLAGLCMTSVDHGHDHTYTVDADGNGSTSFDALHSHGIVGFKVREEFLHTHELLGGASCTTGVPHLGALPSGEDLEKSAIEEFGTTDDLRCAGFIFPDGTMLDFCGGGRPRARDHREIEAVVPEEIHKQHRDHYAERTHLMWWFMKHTGAVRFKPEAKGAEFPCKPTWPQVEAIVRGWRRAFERGTELLADVWVKDDPDHQEHDGLLLDRNSISTAVGRLAEGLGAPLTSFEASGGLPFFRSCEGWPKDLLPALDKLIQDEREISAREFLERVDDRTLQELVQGMRFSDFEDFVDGAEAVTTYHEVVGYEDRIVYFSWSHIEYVFADEDAIEELNEQAKQEGFAGGHSCGALGGVPHLEEPCNGLRGWDPCLEGELYEAEKLAVRAFGVTSDSEEAGYVLRCGLMLDFSGRSARSSDTTLGRPEEDLEGNDQYRWDDAVKRYVPRKEGEDPQSLQRSTGHEQICDHLDLAEMMAQAEFGMSFEEWADAADSEMFSEHRGTGRLCERWFMDHTGAMRFHQDRHFIYAEATGQISFEQAVQITRAAGREGKVLIDIYDESAGDEYGEISLTEGRAEPPVRSLVLDAKREAKSASGLLAQIERRLKNPEFNETTAFQLGLRFLGRGGFAGLPQVGAGDSPEDLAVKTHGLAGALAQGHGLPHLEGLGRYVPARFRRPRSGQRRPSPSRSGECSKRAEEQCAHLEEKGRETFRYCFDQAFSACMHGEPFSADTVPDLGALEVLHPAAQALKENAPTAHRIDDAAFILRDGTMVSFGDCSGHEDVLLDYTPRDSFPGELLNPEAFILGTGSVRVVHAMRKLFFQAGQPPSSAQTKVMLDAHATGKTGLVFELELVHGDGKYDTYQDEHPSAKKIRFFFNLHQKSQLGGPGIAEQTLELLGETKDLTEAIFILEDGRMLKATPEAIRSRGYMMGHEAVCDAGGPNWRAWTDQMFDDYFDFIPSTLLNEEGELPDDEGALDAIRDELIDRAFRGSGEAMRDACIEFFMSSTGAVRHASFGGFTTATRLEVQSMGMPTDEQIGTMAAGMRENLSRWILLDLGEEDGHRFINFTRPPSAGQLKTAIERAFGDREETLNVGVGAELAGLDGVGIQRISPQEAINRKLFGPVYHGTTADRRASILEEGFRFETGESKAAIKEVGGPVACLVRHGFPCEPYVTSGEIPPPVHFLGYGVYFTTVKKQAEQYGEVKEEFYLDVPRVEEINFASPHKMMAWWRENGYDPEVAAEDRVVATAALTDNLKARFDAVWFTAKSLWGKRNLDGDQICVFEPEGKVFVVDKSLSGPYDIGARVRRKSDRMLGEIVGKRCPEGLLKKNLDLAESRLKEPLDQETLDRLRAWKEKLDTAIAEGAHDCYYAVRWRRGGTTPLVYSNEFEPAPTKRSADLGHLLLRRKKYVYRITYDKTTPESAKAGGYADSGYVEAGASPRSTDPLDLLSGDPDEGDFYDRINRFAESLQELADVMKNEGFDDPSQYSVPEDPVSLKRVSYSTPMDDSDPDASWRHTLHFVNLTGAEILEVLKLVGIPTESTP